MSALPILIWSHYRGDAPSPFQAHIDAGQIREVREWDITETDFETAPAVLTTMHLDQIRAQSWQPYFSRLLARGGRIALSGHIMRPFLDGLSPYIAAERPGRGGLVLTVLAEHPIFSGIDRIACGSRRGVAGFYGRGHNPMPPGAVALTGLGPTHAPIDWIWDTLEGGSVFSHAGNDLWGVSEDNETTARLISNLVAWACNTKPSLDRDIL